jgi:DeoR family transcriptional regulator, suf operon transcriptional repressor
MIQKQLTGSPAGELLTALQRRGQATVKDLEDVMGVTATAVRQQLAVLLAEGFIDARAENIGRGRPKHIYTLNVKGRALFPHHYDEFTNSLLREILLTEGPQKVQDLLARLSKRMADQYAQQIDSAIPAERMLELTELLNAKGIMAEVQLEADGIVFREYTCPYYELAREYRAICDMEQGMIAQVINQPVELIACSLDGHHGCKFKIDTESNE